MINPPVPRATPTPTPTSGTVGIAPPTITNTGEKRKLDKLPGAFNISIADPVGGAIENQQQSDDFFNGLGQALFGEGTGSVFGGIPLLGPAVRGASAIPGVELISKGIGSALGAGVGQIVGAAERVPLGWLPGGSDETFRRLPRTPEWEAVNEASNRDVLAGGNLKFDYTQKWLEDQQLAIREPDGIRTLSPGLMAGPGGSLGGLVGQLLGLFQLGQRGVERGLAGTAKLSTGLNRVQEVAARAQNGLDLSPVEQLVVTKVGDGSWTEERALDFMASHGAGLSSNEVLQIAGSFATDPTVLAGLGTGALSRLAVKGATVIESGVGASTFLERAGVAVRGTQAGQVGHAFKVARTVIDPLSAIGGRTPAGRATVDLLTEDIATRAFLGAHATDLGAGVRHMLDDLGMDADAFFTAAGGRGATYARMILAEGQQGRAIVTNKAEGLLAPGEEVASWMSRAPADIVQRIRERAFEHRNFIWDDASKTELGMNLARRFGGDEALVVARTLKQSDDNLGLMHDVLYAGDEGAFRKAADAGRPEYTGTVPYERLNMMDRTTLTDLGAAGFLNRVGNLSVDSDEAIAALNELQTNFPSTRLYGKNVQYAIDDLTRKLEAGLDGSLPHQITGDEMKNMPQAVQDFFADNPHRTLGFRPPDGQLWNLEFDPVTGKLRASGDPWVEHVFEGVTYRPGLALPFNLAGQVLPVRGAVKALDWLDAGPRLLGKRVSGAQIRASAEQRFVKSALANSKGVMTEALARRAFRTLTDHLDSVQKPTVTSLSTTDLWETVKPILPWNSRLQPRDVLRWVVEGFEGDLALVGLSQKFANKLRTGVAELTGSNALYQISQDVYGQLKFRGPLAIKFKMQETIEPFALNLAEGSRIGERSGMGIRAAGLDVELDSTLRNLGDSSLVRMYEQTELLEQSRYALRADTVKADMGQDLSRLQRLLNPAISEYKRIAQLGMMRARLGTAVRKAFEADGRLADWIEFKAEYARAIGRTVDDGEYAQHWLNHVQSATLSLGDDGKRLDLDGIFHEAETWGPADVGQIRKLGLDMAAKRLDGLKNWEINNINDLVNAMRPTNKVAPGDLIREADIREALGTMAPKAYVDRFMTALNFDWGRFWKTAADKYSMTPAEATRIQTWVSEVAHTQGFQPTEFLSQVVSSGMKQTWSEDEIAKNMALGLNILRTAKGADSNILAQQLSAAFIGHLHPSGRESLVRAMGMSDDILAPAPVSAGVPPAGVFEDVTDPLRGVEEVRNVAASYMQSRGLPVPPRRFLQVDPDFGLRTARVYDALPNSAPVKPGPPVTQGMLEAADTKLKSTKVDAATRRAYQAFVDETVEQYRAIRAAGVEIVPTQTNPYPNSAAMVADVRDNKRLLVFADSAEHPLLTDAQNVMFRGVHDYFAHAAEGFQFGPRGEVNAAIKHSQMYSDEARRAMLTETHGQNSYVNFSDKVVGDKTVADVNKATPGAIYADQKAALLPQEILDEFSAKYVGTVAPAAAPVDDTLNAAFAERLIDRVTSGVESADPNLENAYRYFSEWAQKTMSDSALGRVDNPLMDSLRAISPGGKPYDHTQGALLDTVFSRMREMENETYRLQFFSRDRTLFERSLNHPMFALYPASYMWFKIMPQMVKFVAKSPFGLNTGAVAYAIADIQKDIAIQREFDPEFGEMLDGVDSNQLLWFFSYMIPATPWDIPSSWPAWARDLAGQGLANQRRSEEGKPIKGLNVRSIAERAFTPLDPFATPKLGFSTLGALGDLLSGTQAEQKENPGNVGVTSQIAGPVQELAAPLSDAMTELERILAQQ